MSGARKPLNFDLGNADPIPIAQPAASRAAKPSTPKEQRQQVGARIRTKTYRKLKARAALEGRKVQDLVELAVEKYLAEAQPDAQERP